MLRLSPRARALEAKLCRMTTCRPGRFPSAASSSALRVVFNVAFFGSGILARHPGPWQPLRLLILPVLPPGRRPAPNAAARHDAHLSYPRTLNGRFPDSEATKRVARQNKDMKCPKIPSGNHGMVNRTHDEFPDTNRC